ncbi:ribonuclease H-like domain-containing protein [Tanacetum coccineum]
MFVYGYTDGEYENEYGSDTDNVSLISKLGISNHLHLHPNDSATLTVVSVKLNGTENYQVWSCTMLLALEGKNKTGFIDGSCRRSNTDEVLGRQWDRVNAIVLGWILNSISEKLFLGNFFSKRAKHVWDELKETYDKFLMGLDDSYMQIRSNILSRDPLPDVRGAYAIISSEESHRVVSTSSVGASKRPNNVTRPSGGGNRRTNGGPQLVCENCGFNGHTIDSSLSTFSDDQLSKIISLIKDNSLNNGKGVQANMAAGVIVDSGANQHLTYTDKYLVNVINISNLGIKVSHPNGTEAVITSVGNMDLREMKILGTSNQIDGLYYFNDENQDQVLKVLKHDLAFDNSDLDHCEICQKSKQTKEPFPLSINPLCLLNWSVWVYMLKGKDEVFDCVLTFYNLIKNQFGKTVKTFRSDNGTEFVNNVFDKFCIDNGIVHQTTCAYTPQQNGIVERKHRHLLNVARSLLFQGGLPLYLWSECIMTAAYLINRLPSSVLNGKTSFELVFNKKPVLKHLRVFGSLCYATVLNLHDKLGSRAEKCVLVGYASFKKGYKLYSLERKQFIYSRDVRFFEKVFPFKIRQTQDTNLTSQGLDHVNFFNEIVHENLDTSKDDTSNPAGSQSDGSHPSNPSNLTIDPFESDLGHSQF